jgi:O-antigen ligase
MLFYFLISLGRFKKRGRVIGLIVLIPIFSFFVFIFFTEFGFVQSRNLGGDAGIRIWDYVISTQGRVSFWNLILNQQEGYTFFGEGPGSVRELLSGKFSNLKEPHNDFIRIYYESGLIGISLFICGLVSYLRYLTKNIFTLPSQLRIQNIFFSASLSLLAFITQALTDNPIVYRYVMAPLGLILGSALSQANTKCRQEEPKHLKRESRKM